MAEEERIPSFSEKDGTDTSQSKVTYVPEEPTPDISISLLDIQMPETPDSIKGQTSDGDTSRLESPKAVKPVLGKVQAKKRLMAFANQFKALPKFQVKPNLSQHSTGALKTKDKTIQDDMNINKSRKKTEEKILAIEEIRREESKSKMLLAEAMAAASMEDENPTSRNTSGTRHMKEKSKHEGMNDDRKNRSRDRKYSERHRHRDKIDKDSSSQNVKDRNGSIERFTQKSSQDREKRKKDKKRKDSKHRDNNKTDTNRDKKEEGRDKKENEKEKQEDTKERTEATKSKKESIKERRNDTSEMEVEGKDKRDKDKDRWKEKILSKSSSWVEVRKSGLTLDDIIHIRRRDNSERSNIKVRTTQDYTRYLEQMLMLNNYRLKRQALIAEGLDGPKKYPPESIKLTKRARGLQLSYCENPRISLLLNISQLLQAVSPERREKIRDICEASSHSRVDAGTEDTVQQKRNWYQQIITTKHKDSKWQTVQLPKSKWDSEDEEVSSVSAAKEEVEEPANQLHVSANQQERCSTTSSVMDEDKIDNKTEGVKEDNKSSDKTTENVMTNDEASTSSLLQPAGNEKLASEYEQFMKMVCTTNDVTKEYSPKRNLVKSTSPHSYHEFDIESNLAEDSINMEISLKEKFEGREQQVFEGSIKSTECEESTLSTDCQTQVNENNVQIECTNEKDNEGSEDSKSVPSDWENVRIKVERLSDENTESRETKRKKKRKKIASSSDSSSSTTSSDSEKEKKRRKRKRKVRSNSSSTSDSDSTDSSSNSSDSSSLEERKKKRRKKKKVGKKRRKAKRIARMKKKRRRKMSTDSNSSDSDEHTKRKRAKKKALEAKSINNGDISKIISKSPVLISSSDGTKILQPVTPVRKIKEEAAAGEDRKRSDQVTSVKKIIADMSVHDNECLKQKKERKESKPDESLMEQWEMDSMMQQNDGDSSSQDRTGDLEKMADSEKGKYRRKRKHSRDNVERDKDKSLKVNEEKIHREGEARSDEEEVETKRKKRREKDVKSSAEFLANWERESERITQQIMQDEAKYFKKLEKQKKEKWGETDFDTLNVPSLTQLEKEVCQKQLLADEWEVDSLEAISDLIMSKRKGNHGSLKKMEKEVRYDKKTDTYIAIEKEGVREMKKRQKRLCAIRIWEEEQEEGEREELMLIEQKSKQHKTDDWDIEEESLFRKNTEEMETCRVNDIVAIEKEWTKTDEEKSVKEDASKLITVKPGKRVKKSRWDMASQAEEKAAEVKDIWEEEYVEWPNANKCEEEFEKAKKGDLHTTDYSESSSKSDLMDFYHRQPRSRESLERSWAAEEVAVRPVQTKDASVKLNLISAKTNEEQFASIKEHQTRDQFKEILESDVSSKFKEKTLELYSPSSPALSQKSQDVEISNGSSSCSSPLREKRKKEMLIRTADELSIPMSGIPLQLAKLRDTKHASKEKIESILSKVQLEDKDPAPHSFDIKTADNLFDDISMNESCPNVNTSEHMDIFAEYGSEKPCSKQQSASSTVSSATHTKDDEANEGKSALKLIPKQLLIRRTNEQVKSKRILETPLQDPAQHAAALLTIQKKLLESHVLKNDIKEYSIEEQRTEDHFEQRYSIASNSSTDNTLLDTTEFSVISKSSAIRQSRSPASEKAVSVRSEQSEDRESKNDGTKRCKINRNQSDTNVPSSVRSPVREHRKRSPSKKESEKRYSHDKDKKERKFDDAEKLDRRDRGTKADFADRRRSSPSGRGRRRRSRSPYVSWERQGSGSGSPGHSWSRSLSKSPKRKDEATTSTRDRDKKRERYDDERLGRSRTDERKERYTRSPPRFAYNEDNFKKHGSSKSNRDDRGRRRHDDVDRDHEKETRSYDPMEILRERAVESERYRDNRFHTEELDHTFWQYENSGIVRDGNESVDSYTVGQDLPLEYDDRSYYREGSLERDMTQSSPQSQPKYRRSRSNARRERQWEKDKDPSDLDRHGHLGHRLRNRTPPRSRYSPIRQAPERFRRKSRSRSRSWSPLRSRSRSRSRSGSRSRSTSRSRPRMRSQSRSRSRSPFDVRSRGKSTSVSRLRSPEHAFRTSERSSRSPSLGRDRLNEMGRERKDDDEKKKFNACNERGRRIETIVQTGIIPGTSMLDSEMGINSVDTAVANFQYSSEIEGGNEYYYTENNLTYPPCIDESSTSSPKRLSLDDRLELELGIKKQHNKDSTVTSEYSSNFNPNVIVYPSPPPQQHQQMMYRQQPTVVQVGNVLQVVPADFNGVQSIRREVSTAAVSTPSLRSSQVVRVGNVLQVVPTSLDWSNSNSSNSSSNGDGSGGGSGGGGTGTGTGTGIGTGTGNTNAGSGLTDGGQSLLTTDQSSGVLYSSAAVSPSAPSIPLSIPVPVPVPLPVPPALPSVSNNFAPVATMSATPLPLSLPVPVPVPVPIPLATPTAFPRNEPQKIAQPVYNYEAILETRRKEREERKRLRELRRKEKERRRIERVNRRALRLLEKSNTSRQASGVSLDHRKGTIVDPSVLKALKEGEEQAESPSANLVKEEEETTASIKEEDEDVAADEEEDDDEDEVEAEAEDDEEEEEEAEDEDEDDDDDEKQLQVINQRIEVDEVTTAMSADANKDQAEVETKKEWPELPPPPLKGILVVPGFRRDAIPNGNLNDSSDADDNIKDCNDKEEEIDKNNEYDKDVGPDVKSGKSNLAKLKKIKRNKKSVQFADGVKPGEGTSPSGGEGDMPSPPPPKGIGFRDGLGDLRRDKIYSSRKNRKQEKRARPPKAKKKVKVKIIKLKKPRITPLTAMMMDDSDEMDDRSPPPPPPGSPPPPHLWPSYLSIYNTTVRAIEQSQSTTTTLTSVQAPPPPTPLPLLIPPPPLNYTIQPCNKS